MNQSPGYMEAKAQEPEDEKDGEDGPKHCGVSSAYVESLGCCRVLAKAHPTGYLLMTCVWLEPELRPPRSGKCGLTRARALDLSIPTQCWLCSRKWPVWNRRRAVPMRLLTWPRRTHLLRGSRSESRYPTSSLYWRMHDGPQVQLPPRHRRRSRTYSQSGAACPFRSGSSPDPPLRLQSAP